MYSRLRCWGTPEKPCICTPHTVYAALLKCQERQSGHVQENPSAAGAPPRCPLRELTTLPRRGLRCPLPKSPTPPSRPFGPRLSCVPFSASSLGSGSGWRRPCSLVQTPRAQYCRNSSHVINASD